MKVMIASDIHGSAVWCKRLMDAYRAENPERLVLLGDILYHGPRNELPDGYAPKQVIAMLSEIKDRISCVRGNCDTEVDQMVLPFSVLSELSILFIEGRVFFCAHGHKEAPPLSKGDYLLSGHTHVPTVENRGNYTYINCGSVSIPKEGSPHSYLVYENGTFYFKDLATGEVYRTHTLVGR